MRGINPEPAAQVVSKERVAAHGEVYTAKREVCAMLDLVKNECERIESRFLEPACGNGNFLAEILRRKLASAERRYGKSPSEYERYSLLAVSSIYGIDILPDNVRHCRERLFDIYSERYISVVGLARDGRIFKSIQFILEKNIIAGDALTLKAADAGAPIIFSEWSLVNGSKIKRRDFTFNELLFHGDKSDLPLLSDAGEDVFLPAPAKEYPLTDYLALGNRGDLDLENRRFSQKDADRMGHGLFI